MRILDWECHTNPDGTARAAQHAESGTIAWVNGRLIANCDAPVEVIKWVMRPMLRMVWSNGCCAGLNATGIGYDQNPYDGEPPNKDNEPS